tara:strand:- start:351 stop:1157 length:807 start_codon:yes stop_codon:yes gene_type:complete
MKRSQESYIGKSKSQRKESKKGGDDRNIPRLTNVAADSLVSSGVTSNILKEKKYPENLISLVKGREEAKKIKQIKQTQSVVRRHLAGSWPLLKALKYSELLRDNPFYDEKKGFVLEKMKNKLGNKNYNILIRDLNWYDIAKLKKMYNSNSEDNFLKEELKRSVAMDFVHNYFKNEWLMPSPIRNEMNTLTFSPSNVESNLDNYLSRPETMKKMLKVYRRVRQYQTNQLKNYISKKIEYRRSPRKEIRNILKDGNSLNPVINILGKKMR